jgi:hypothetical protein
LRENGDDEHIKKLSLWISETDLPEKNLNGQDEFSDSKPSSTSFFSHSDRSTASRQKALTLAHQKATLGLQSLQTLITQLSSPRPSTLDPRIVLSLIAFTSLQDLWTTPTTLQLSQSLLSLYTTQTHSPDFILTSLLNTFIRPIFSHSKPSTITSSGRKAMPSSAPAPKFDAGAERSSKPWKYEVVYAVRVFAWAVEKAPV